MKVHANAALGSTGRPGAGGSDRVGDDANGAAAPFAWRRQQPHYWRHRRQWANSEERSSDSWLLDRSSRPSCRPRLLDAETQERTCEWRRCTGCGAGFQEIAQIDGGRPSWRQPQFTAFAWCAPVVPGGLDQQASGVREPDFGDRSLPAPLTAGALQGHEVEVAHQSGGTLER